MSKSLLNIIYVSAVFLFSNLHLSFSRFCQWIISHLRQRSANCFLRNNSKSKPFLLENFPQTMMWVHLVPCEACLWQVEVSTPGVLDRYALTPRRSDSKLIDDLLENTRSFNTKGEPEVNVGGGVGEKKECGYQALYLSLCCHFHTHYLTGSRRVILFPVYYVRRQTEVPQLVNCRARIRKFVIFSYILWPQKVFRIDIFSPIY